MEASIKIPFLKEYVIMACDDSNWDSTKTLLLQWLKKESLEYQQLMSIPISIPNYSINIIFYSCIKGYIELISVFINNNFPVNYEINKTFSSYCNTMFHFSTAARQLPLMKYLVSHGADVNYVSHAGYTPLHCLFITEGMLNRRNSDTIRMCSSKSQNSQIDVLKFLLDSGSNVRGKCRSGRTPLHYAVIAGNINCAKLLIDYGSDVNARDGMNKTALCYVVTGTHPVFQMVELLLNTGACVNSNYDPKYILYSALKEENQSIIELLVDRGTDFNEKLFRLRNILQRYVFFQNEISNNNFKFVSENVINIVGTLVIWGAYVYIADVKGRNLLHWAAWQGSVHLVKLLIGRGLDVKDKLGKKPIHYARDAGHDNVVQFFIGYYFEKFM